MARSRSLELPRRAFLAALGGAGCGGHRRHHLQIRGSDSEVNLVQRVAEAFMADNPRVSVAVTGGGSGTGIAALIGGTTDIANSSREMKPGEQLLALRKGVKPVATLFCTDALTVIVNADNPLEALRVEQVGAMFAGQITQWADVGGQGDVVAYGRQSSSGTYAFFRKAVVKGDYAQSVRKMNGNGQIVEGVARDPGGIGYVAVGYLKAGAEGIKALKIVGPDGKAVSPLDEADVRAGRYPIARPLYQLTNGRPTGDLLDFLRYELSPAGEAIITEMGFYPLADQWKPRNAHLAEGPVGG